MSTPGLPPTPPTPTEFATFTRQLGAMLEVNVDVLRALRIASHHTGNRRLIEASREVARRLEDGRELHFALGQHPELFDAFYIEMVRQGEADGTLGKALLIVADYLDRCAATAHPSGAVAPASAVAAGASALPSVFGMLGMIALGTALIWALATAGSVPAIWAAPLSMFWCAVCLLVDSRLLHQPTAPPEPPPAAAPPKPPERRAAELDGVVRSALQEQEDEQEAAAARPAASTPPGPGGNGKPGAATTAGADESVDPLEPFDPDANPPRFTL
jgi:hypothetical protein